MIDDQGAEAGGDAVGEKREVRDRGYGHGGVERKQSQQNTSIPRVGSDNSVVDQYGTPKDERSDPMEEWKTLDRSYGKGHRDPLTNRGQTWEIGGF